MINLYEVQETNKMIEESNLDVRTITMGISLLDCCDNDVDKVCENIYNVFDPVVTKEHLELNYIKSIFNSYGAVGYQMTGSGSAVFAIVQDVEYAAVICDMLKENYPQIFIAKPV